MVTGFENVTFELKEIEFKIMDQVVKGLSNRTVDNPIKSTDIVKALNTRNEHQINEPRLRKIISYIRMNAILPIIATHNGYYCASNKDEIKEQIKSLNERADQINNTAHGLARFLK
jgi:hypothetical protein